MQVYSPRFLSPLDYLEHEIREEARHDYVDGAVYALSGGSVCHSKLIMNVVAVVLPVANRGACHVHSQGVKVRVAARNSYYYPDVVATCEPVTKGEYIINEPCFIVEVLSPSTASIDRREKRLAYTTLDSLTEYVLVYQDRMRVDVYQRTEGGWNLAILREPEQAIDITCLRCSLALEQIYKGVDLPLSVSEVLNDEWALG